MVRRGLCTRRKKHLRSAVFRSSIEVFKVNALIHFTRSVAMNSLPRAIDDHASRSWTRYQHSLLRHRKLREAALGGKEI
jgi:hypothetical protein